MFSIHDIRKYDKKSSNGYKYIRKVQDCKVFYCDEVDHMSYKNPLIRMRDCSGDDESISYIQ